MDRKKALEELAKFGIKDAYIYLVDLLPLIEMIWADGKAQKSELVVFEDYLRKHVQRINELAGHIIIDYLQARGFVEKFLTERPDPELLKTLRSLVAPTRLGDSGEVETGRLKDSLLAACMDIASSSVVEYPYGLNERFDPAEKKCFFEIMESLEKEAS